jgi:dsRNA-specific ribonuclease
MTHYITEGLKIINDLGEEEIIQIPYNINNILVNEDDILKLLAQCNVKLDKINDISQFREAFTHKSYCKKTIFPDHILEDSKKELGNPCELLELREDSYERMEYFGDRVLEGFMTRLQTKLEDKTNLALMSKEIGLGKFFIISKHIEFLGGRNSERIHEDTFEAFIGALFLSNGFEPCCMLIVNLLETLVDYSEKLYCDNNYKDILLRYHHQMEWTHPKYDVIYFEGPAHKRKYIVGVQKHDTKTTDKIQDKYIGYGVGNSHKQGEQLSAMMALIIYQVLNEDQYSKNDIFYPNWLKIEAGETNILLDTKDYGEDCIIAGLANVSINNDNNITSDKKN